MLDIFLLVTFVCSAGADLISAAKAGRWKEVHDLVDQGADVNAKNRYGITTLMFAVQAKDDRLDDIRYLIQHGANVNAKKNNEDRCLKQCGYTAVMWASWKGRLLQVMYLVQQGAQVNQTSDTGDTALLLAAEYDHWEVVRFLVLSGAKLDDKKHGESGVAWCNVECGYTALMWASMTGRFLEVMFLVQQGAKVNQKSETGETALLVATQHGHVQVAEYLVQQGARVDEMDAFDLTALMNAASQGNLKMVKFLYQNGAQVGQGNRKRSPLKEALWNGHFDTSDWLLDHGAELGDEFLSLFCNVSGAIEFLEHWDASPKLGYECLASMNKDFASAWLSKGGNPWAFRDDGVSYDSLIFDPEAFLLWEKHMTTERKLQGVVTNPQAYLSLIGGFALGACMVRFKRWYLKKDLTAFEEQNEFYAGARRIAAYATAPRYSWARRLFRYVEVICNVLFMYAVGMTLIWWPYFLPLWAWLFLMPAAARLGHHLIDSPALAAATPYKFSSVLFSAVRFVAISFMVLTMMALFPEGKTDYYHEAPFRDAFTLAGLPWLLEKLIPRSFCTLGWQRGDDLDLCSCSKFLNPKVSMLGSKQHGFLASAGANSHDWTLSRVRVGNPDAFFNLLWLVDIHSVWPAAMYIDAFVAGMLWIGLLYLLVLVSFLLYACFSPCCCDRQHPDSSYCAMTSAEKEKQDQRKRIVTELMAGALPEVAIAKSLQPISDEVGNLSNDTTPETLDGLGPSEPMKLCTFPFFWNLWFQLLMILVDVLFDLNTIWTLIVSQNFLFAFFLTMTSSFCLFESLAAGRLQNLFTAADESIKREVFHIDVVELLKEETGFEAFTSLAITSYSLLYCVSSLQQTLIQFLSIAFSIHGQANFLYEQVDLELLEKEDTAYLCCQYPEDEENDSKSVTSSMESRSSFGSDWSRRMVKVTNC